MVRDPVSGAITKVLGPSSDSRGEEEGGGGGGGGGRGANPLNDPLNAFDSEDDEDDGRRGEKDDSEEGVDDERRGKKDVGVGIVRELEEAARAGEGGGKKRMQSRREKEWIETLVERWGEDWGGMMRDRRLNPQQHGEGDLKRRVRRWREERGQTMAVI